MTSRIHETVLLNLHAAPKPPLPPCEQKYLSITAKSVTAHFAKFAHGPRITSLLRCGMCRRGSRSPPPIPTTYNARGIYELAPSYAPRIFAHLYLILVMTQPFRHLTALYRPADFSPPSYFISTPTLKNRSSALVGECHSSPDSSPALP